MARFTKKDVAPTPSDNKIYRLSSVGDFTVTLRGTRKETVRNDFGEAIGVRTIPPLQLVFVAGECKTDDKDKIQLIQDTTHWGNDVFWHPTCLPEDATEQEIQLSENISRTAFERIKRQKEAHLRALEGNIPIE